MEHFLCQEHGEEFILRTELNRNPDIVIKGQPYWTIDVNGRPCIYSVGPIGDYYISVFDSMMMDDEPQELYDWYKTVAPPNVLVYL